MSENRIQVVAIATTSADKSEELKSICKRLIEPTRKEQGCTSYELYQDTDDRGKFVFIENWQSQEYLDVHLKSPHLLAAVEAFDKIITEEIVIMKLNKLA